MRGFFLTHYRTLGDASWMSDRPDNIYKHLEFWYAKGVSAERLMELVKDQRAYLTEL
jgi:hypothetical protein